MTLGFIGAGKMGEALLASFLRARILSPRAIVVCDADARRRKTIRKTYGVRVKEHNVDVAAAVEILFLCVKPYQMEDVLKEIAPVVTRKHLVVSIAAGRKLAGIRAGLPKARVIRVMPNLPCVVGEGMCAFATGATATTADRRTVHRLLSACGAVVEVSERQLDAVTALSGSGPAFVARVLDALVEGAVAEGLSRRDALTLAAQTFLGTARLLIGERMDPKTLVEKVATPGGTTRAGLDVLEAAGVPDALVRTIRAAARRSRELSGSVK